jgi:hypothetical protein
MPRRHNTLIHTMHFFITNVLPHKMVGNFLNETINLLLLKYATESEIVTCDS